MCILMVMLACTRNTPHTNIDVSTRNTLSILEKLIQEMSLYYGTCSRIKTTPLCFGYVIHVRTIILIYLLSCPPTLIAQGIASYALLLAMTVLTFAILTVDELAADCENPFGVSLLKKEAFKKLLKRERSPCRGHLSHILVFSL